MFGKKYYCIYCGSKMKHDFGAMYKCTRKSCAAEAWEEDGELEFDDEEGYDEDGCKYEYEEVFDELSGDY